MSNEVLIQDLTTDWAILDYGQGTYINNGPDNIYIQRNPTSTPNSTDIGFIVTMGGQFFVDKETALKTYVRAVSSNSTIARI